MSRLRNQHTSRREFISGFAAALSSIALRGKVFGCGGKSHLAVSDVGQESKAGSTGKALLGGRFLTFATVVRVNQIEVRRGEGIGQDETAAHTPEAVAAFRHAFAQGWPDGRMTWALSWLALTNPSEQYKGIRKRVAEYHDRYGDEVTFIPGGHFANAYNTREQVVRDLHDQASRWPQPWWVQATAPKASLPDSSRPRTSVSSPNMRVFMSAEERLEPILG